MNSINQTMRNLREIDGLTARRVVKLIFTGSHTNLLHLEEKLRHFCNGATVTASGFVKFYAYLDAENMRMADRFLTAPTPAEI